MHKVILMMLLAVISSSATAAWTKIVDAKDNTDGPNQGSLYSVYVDRDTMRNSNDFNKNMGIIQLPNSSARRWCHPIFVIKGSYRIRLFKGAI